MIVEETKCQIPGCENWYRPKHDQAFCHNCLKILSTLRILYKKKFVASKILDVYDIADAIYLYKQKLNNYAT